jgi:hypothetical protein
MAIDICNKLDLLDSSRNPIEWHTHGGLPDVDLGTDLHPAQRQSMTLAAEAVRSHVDPRAVAGDPSAWASDFGYALDRASLRVDMRGRDALREAALRHADPVLREQALFEYADRNEPDAVSLLAEAVRNDDNRELRWAALWAIQKLGGKAAIQQLQAFRKDADPEVAEWAHLLTNELKTSDPTFDKRPYRFLEGRTFDQTIYLLIHCDLYIRLDDTNRSWGKLSMSPQALRRVFGQGHACPNVATRERQLIIAKVVEGLHPDGSPHVDNYLFRGFTDRSSSERGNFFFESHVKRPFFLSGKADDESAGVRDANIGFIRHGTWFLDPSIRVRGESAIRYVRGRFQGWGFANLDRLGGKPVEEILTPGNAILSTLHDPVVGPRTNVFIAGTFKGKLCDWDADGRLDLNSLNVYSTVDGEIDTNMDGVADKAGVSCCEWRSPF